MQYVFGDSDLAAQRLELLAEVFAEPTKAFLAEAVADRPRLALDLGCGPGFTTHLLAERLSAKKIIGIDNSEHFIELAKGTGTEAVSFCLHDITEVPFPTEPADLIYCRYLLSHLEDPQALVARWADHLLPGGVLLIEETEHIHTTNSVFRFYLDIVEDMLSSRGARLYVGPVIDRVPESDRLKRRSSIVRPHRAQTHSVAAMFYMNIQTWKNDPFIKENYQASDIEALENDLQQLASKAGDAMEIQWGLRQIVFERA